MLRELFILVLVASAFASAVAAYLAVCHDETSLKLVLSSTFAATVGFYIGRYVERRLIRG